MYYIVIFMYLLEDCEYVIKIRKNNRLLLNGDRSFLHIVFLL